MHRTVIIGADPAALATAERLVRGGMCVDLYTDCPAPFGLLNNLGGCTGGATPLLRLIGNVRVGDGIGDDISAAEIHQLGDTAVDTLKARGIPVTTWEGVCADTLANAAPINWDEIAVAARRIPICV